MWNSASPTGPSRKQMNMFRGIRSVQPAVPLVPVTRVTGASAKALFPFSHFNPVQSSCFELAYNSDCNLVVSAPTGSGKTCIMEMAILRLIRKHSNARIDAKIVYIAPTKALCSERAQDWKKKFRTLGVSCGELTGDTDSSSVREVQQSNIIVTTPEKWDSMTRRWRDYKHLMALVQLILIDEVHLLNEPRRGAVLEVIVSRMRTVNAEVNGSIIGEDKWTSSVAVNQSSHFLRILAISATAPNIADIAVWLKDARGRNAEIKLFGDEFRPVKLDRYVLGFSQNTSEFLFDNNLDYKLTELIGRYSQGKPTLVFCSTKKSVESAARRLVLDAQDVKVGSNHPYVRSCLQQMELQEAAHRVADKKLAEFLPHGIAIHYGNLDHGDRQLVESLFIKGTILVICTTSTLSVGINLPAHLVILKGTRMYRGTEYVEYSDLDVMQMMGRAGRPQFDDSGTVLVLTTLENVKKYEGLVSGTEMIESSLHLSLIEHLNAEVVLGTIPNMELCIEWLKSTFLNVRISKNPSRYQRQQVAPSDRTANTAATSLENICFKDLSLLAQVRLIEQKDDGMRVLPTDYGRLMAKYYIRFETAKAVMDVKCSPTMRTLLECLSSAEEFAEIKFHGEKTYFNTLNKTIKYPVTGKMTTSADKVNVMIQCILGTIRFTEVKFSSHLNTESNVIMSHAARVSKFMFEVFTLKKDYQAASAALDLTNAIHAKAWESGGFHLKQIESIGPVHAKTLFDAGVRTIGDLLDRPAEQIESILNRGRLFGNKLLEAANMLPQLTLSASEEIGKSDQVEFFLTLGLRNPKTVSVTGKKGALHAIFLAADIGNNELLEYRMLSLRDLKTTQTISVRCVRRKETSQVTFCLIAAEFVGLRATETAVVQGNPASRAAATVNRPLKTIVSARPSLPVAATFAPSVSNAALSKLDGKRVKIEDEFDSMEELDNFDWSILDSEVSDERGKQRTTVSNVSRESPPVHKKPKKNDAERVVPPSVNLKDGRVSCSHACKDKENCEHLCCKFGIKPSSVKAKRSKGSTAKPSKKGAKSSTTSMKQSDDSESDEIPLTRRASLKPITPLLSTKVSDNDSDDDDFDLMSSNQLLRRKKKSPVNSGRPLVPKISGENRAADDLFSFDDKDRNDHIGFDDEFPSMYELDGDYGGMENDWPEPDPEEEQQMDDLASKDVTRRSTPLFSDCEDALDKNHQTNPTIVSVLPTARGYNEMPKSMSDLNKLHLQTASTGSVKPWERPPPPTASIPTPFKLYFSRRELGTPNVSAAMPVTPVTLQKGDLSWKRTHKVMDSLNRLHESVGTAIQDSTERDSTPVPKQAMQAIQTIQVSKPSGPMSGATGVKPVTSLNPITSRSEPVRPNPIKPACETRVRETTPLLDLLSYINGLPEKAEKQTVEKEKVEVAARPTGSMFSSFAAFLANVPSVVEQEEKREEAEKPKKEEANADRWVFYYFVVKDFFSGPVCDDCRTSPVLNSDAIFKGLLGSSAPPRQ
ncbi:Sec63 Brl domain-containing protein [Chytriomyces cf. hyalinus JEL632]|nr:Sec63 Brl domain-containing protein [Chytriomyces cf. hyalinus JEL632]